MTTDTPFDPETDISVPKVEDAEIKRVLDIIDGKRPYGSGLMAHLRTLLEVVAKDVEIRAFYRQEVVFEEWKVDGFVKAINRPVHRLAARKALEEFAAPRAEQAGNLYALSSELTAALPRAAP